MVTATLILSDLFCLFLIFPPLHFHSFPYRQHHEPVKTQRAVKELQGHNEDTEKYTNLRMLEFDTCGPIPVPAATPTDHEAEHESPRDTGERDQKR